MSRLTWRPLVRADVRDLQHFCCAEPRPSRSSGRPDAPRDPWACEAESFIRAGRVRKPPRFMLVGRDRDGIGAAARFREEDGSTFFFIETIGVARHLRRAGLGDEAVDQVVDAITDRALARGVSEALVRANVHQDNKPSLAMLERWGFREQWRDGNYLAYATRIYF